MNAIKTKITINKNTLSQMNETEPMIALMIPIQRVNVTSMATS